MLRGVDLTPSLLDLRTQKEKTTYTFQEFLDVYAQFLKVSSIVLFLIFLIIFFLLQKERESVDDLIVQLKSFDHENDGRMPAPPFSFCWTDEWN